MSEQKGPAVGLGFIDILFAIVVGIGLREVIERPWVTDLLGNWSRLDLWVFTLVNTVVIASWVGYHKMMAEGLDPEIKTWQGFFRFVVDVLLLFLYFKLLVNLDSPEMALELIAFIFLFYVVWDCIVLTERRVERRGGVTIFWCLCFWAIYYLGFRFPYTAGELSSQALCGASISGVFAYRLHKWHKASFDPIVIGPLAGLQEWVFGRFRKHSNDGLRVYVAGPYTAPFERQVLENVQKAIDVALKLYQKGHYPYVPHLTHYIHKRAQELGLNITREDYVRRWDSPWLELCDAVLFLAESPGAREELQMAQKLGKKIFYGKADEIPAAISS